ncbi:MAG: anthranilate phosphoribosyltransferase [Acidobacteria bacterium]|nr:anthranilate phosphoribosyltransferase [Acidobacteriota bacterium]
MIAELLNKLIAKHDLTQGEAAALLDAMLGDRTTDAQIAAALVALAAKGETEEELAGFAETMRARSVRITTKHSVFVDTCGTGGSTAKTFNVSTAAAFVVAAAGVAVAKHGNVGVTSKSGSADVLRALGVKVDLPPERVAEIFDEIGVCFMFAPLHHAATKRVAMIRWELGVRTIFNLLGPLTNPAGAPFQVLGVSSEPGCEKVAKALARLGTRRAWVVRGTDGLDEITLAGKTVVYEAATNSVRRFEIWPEDFHLRQATLDELRGGTAEENAAIIRSVFSGERKDAARDLVMANAAASLFVAGEADSLPLAAEKAAQVLSSGAALAKLESLVRSTQG